jgi:hypothetical protein
MNLAMRKLIESDIEMLRTIADQIDRDGGDPAHVDCLRRRADALQNDLAAEQASA